MKREHITFAQCLVEHRLEKDMSQGDLAIILKLTTNQFISNIECGKALPPAKMTIELEKIFGVKKNTFVIAVAKDKARIAEKKFIDQVKKLRGKK